MSKTHRQALAVATIAALAAFVPATTANAVPNNNSVKKLTKAVTLDGVMDHLEACQAIADEHGDRAAGRPGYEAAVDYVVEQLEGAGYDPVVQAFEFDYFDENNELIRVSPNPTTYVDESDFVRNFFDTGSPEGTGTGTLVAVDLMIPPAGVPNTSSSGCDAADFAGFPVGGIALMQ